MITKTDQTLRRESMAGLAHRPILEPVSSSVTRTGRENGARQAKTKVCTIHVESGWNQCHGSQNHMRVKIMKVQESQRKQRKPVC